MHDLWVGRGKRLLLQPVATKAVQTCQDSEVPAAEKQPPRPPAAEADTEPDPHAQLVAELFEPGEPGRTARALMSAGLADRSWASFVQLRYYHPPGTHVAPENAESPRGEGDNHKSTTRDKLPGDDLIKNLRQSGLHGAGGRHVRETVYY